MPPQNVQVLNVAEKPSVARALAGAFHRMPGARESAPMRREAAQIFTHDQVSFPPIFSQGSGQPSNTGSIPHTMITSSVRGHLASTDFPPEYGWSRCDPLQLFDAPLQTLYKEDMQPLYQMLTRLSKNVQAVILWLDCDREGEAIAAEVQDVCIQSNPRLRNHIYRAKFSTVLDGEIRRALMTLGKINDAYVQAVAARSQIDLRVGAAFTRFQTLRLQKKFQLSGNASVVSYGPCQFPTLGFVVERWARIETFVPEDFWFLELTLRIAAPVVEGEEGAPNINNDANRPIVFSWKRQRLYDRLMTMVLYDSCLDAEQAVVTQLSGRPKNKWRPIPLATVELQKRASRYLRIGSETLMTAAEELYQQGYISYPRTETERFRPEFQHRPLIQDFVNANGPFSEYANDLLSNGGFQNPRAGPHDDQAHPPITPCKAVDPATITDATQRGVYTLVVKHYLACCSRDAVGRETSITVKMATEEFTAKGLMILEYNWLKIYEPWERWSTGQGELPPVEVGSRITPSSLLMKEGRTTPPQPISEVELISMMDRNGIGTDATIAQHITTIQEREYAKKDGGQRFLPTPLGIALVEGYNQMGHQLNKPDLRRDMERECNLVANGQKTKDDVIIPILNRMRQCYITAVAEAQKLDDAVARHFPRLGAGNDTTIVLQVNFSECGVCHNRMTLKQERQNRQGGNENRTPRKLLFCNTCQTGWGLPRGQMQPKTEQDNGGPPFKCPICSFQVIRVVRGDGYEGNGYHVCPKCFTDSPQEHGGASNAGNFRCFSCTHAACSLAGGTQGGDVEVFACPFCNSRRATTGKVTLRKNSRGYVLSCSNYSGREKCSYTIWLPRASQTVTVPAGDDSLCNRCSSPAGPVRKVSFEWKPGGVPPHLGRSCTVCVLCDVHFREELDISLPQPNRVMTTPRRPVSGAGRGRVANLPNNNTNSSNNVARNNTNNVCFRCSQPGHYANNCPRNRG